MSTSEEKKFRPLVLIFLVLGAGAFFFIFLISVYGFSDGPSPKNAEISIVIPPDSSFKTISKILVENKIIIPDPRFRVLAGLMGVTEKLRAGDYIFTGSLSPYQVLKMMARGSMVQRAITIPEGANLSQIADIFSRDGWLSRERFLSMCNDKNFIASLGLSVSNLEGYLFPDTYFFDRGGISPQKIITTMVNRMREVIKMTGAELDTNPTFNLHELLTLASIVEKETAKPNERPLIASVFLNRLKKGMKLQTDPTVIYGINNFNGNLTRNDLTTLTPYNTYMIKGLPPGPIGSPGKAAIEAVLNPAEESYYYFVSKNDGSHYFSKSLEEHNRAVARYQRRNYLRKKRRVY